MAKAKRKPSPFPKVLYVRADEAEREEEPILICEPRIEDVVEDSTEPTTYAVYDLRQTRRASKEVKHR